MKKKKIRKGLQAGESESKSYRKVQTAEYIITVLTSTQYFW